MPRPLIALAASLMACAAAPAPNPTRPLVNPAESPQRIPDREPGCLDGLRSSPEASRHRAEAADARASANAAAAAVSTTGEAVDAIPYEPPIIASIGAAPELSSPRTPLKPDPPQARQEPPAVNAPGQAPVEWRGQVGQAAPAPNDPC